MPFWILYGLLAGLSAELFLGEGFGRKTALGMPLVGSGTLPFVF